MNDFRMPPHLEPDLFMDQAPAGGSSMANEVADTAPTRATLQARSQRADRMREDWLSKPADCFDEWMKRAKRGRPMGDSSQKVYRSMWLKFVKHAPQGALSDVEDVEAFLSQTVESGSMLVSSLTQQRRYLALLAAVQDELVAAGALQINAAREILEMWNADAMGLRRNLPVALNPQQEGLVIERLSAMPTPHWISQRDVALASLVLGSGLKVHELQKLRVRDVIFTAFEGDVAQIRATTNGMRERRAPLAAQHEPLVKRWIDWLKGCGINDLDFVFLSHESDGHGHFDPEIDFGVSAWVANRCIEPMSAAHIWRVINRLLGECGLSEELARQGPTVLRNTFAVRQLRHGVPLEKVSLWLGHKDPRSTKVYEPLLSGHAQIAG